MGHRAPAVAAAVIDPIVHYAEALTVIGASYRLRSRGIVSLSGIRTTTTTETES